MTSGERRRRIEEICDAALDYDAMERRRFVASACGDDVMLRQEVEALLAHAQTAAGFLATPVEEVAAQVMVGDAGSLVGRQFGAYRMLSRLGAGGMGEVYRARDSRLRRDVAIKVLPSSFAADPEQHARFEREARVLAALNHPHIASIYGVEDVDGASVLVLEFVAGETLAARIRRGPIPLREALPFAQQIADALDAAHEKGIVHRDLKPSNIGLTNDGTVKVLDFGLAKAVETVAADVSQPTITFTGLDEGRVLGTAAYMSPEQARGQAVDKRTDIWAFGCVFYEMLAGQTAFTGASTADRTAAILERDPDWAALPGNTPTHIRRLLRRCLEKDPKQRLRDIGDARLELAQRDEQPTTTARRGVPATALTAAMALIVLAAVGVAVFASLSARRVGPELGAGRFEVPTPPTSDPGSFALSSDGRQLAFVSAVDNVQRLWIRQLDQLTPRPLAGTEGARYPFWAPNGTAIGFFADAKLKRIDIDSGVLQVLADAPRPLGGSWSGNGVIVFAPTATSPLMRLPANGGTPVPVTQRPPTIEPHLGGSYRFPQFLPDGRHFLFFVRGLPERRGVYVGSIDGAEPSRVLAEAETPAQFAPPGLLLLVRQGTLVAYRFDAARGIVSGDPMPVAQDVGTGAEPRGEFSVSAAGVLAHRAGAGRQRRQLVWVDRAGVMQGSVGPADESSLRLSGLSPDGLQVAVDRTIQGNTDVWLIDTNHGVPSRFTFDASADIRPVWSPDGRRVAFASTRNGALDIYEKPVSGAGDEQPLLVTATGKVPMTWSPDGRFLIYGAINLKTGVDDLWALSIVGEHKTFPFVQTTFEDGAAAQFSPDGRWVAYESNESGPVAIFVRPFPGPGRQWQVTAGGTQPRWSPDGKELFYVAPDGRLMAVPIAMGADQTLLAGPPTRLFQTRLASGNDLSIEGTDIIGRPQYAVASDGRFLMNVAVEGVTPPPITVVLNWPAALKK